MKLTKHADGTISITGILAEELSDLAHAASCTVAHCASNPGGIDQAFMSQQRERFERLYRALSIVGNYPGASGVTYLPAGKSCELIAGDWTHADNAYGWKNSNHVRVVE